MTQLYKDLCKIKAGVMAGLWCQEGPDGTGRDGAKLCLMRWTSEIAGTDYARGHDLYVALLQEIGGSLVRWNDTPGRTQADVVALVNRAAIRASQQGA